MNPSFSPGAPATLDLSAVRSCFARSPEGEQSIELSRNGWTLNISILELKDEALDALVRINGPGAQCHFRCRVPFKVECLVPFRRQIGTVTDHFHEAGGSHTLYHLRFSDQFSALEEEEYRQLLSDSRLRRETMRSLRFEQQEFHEWLSAPAHEPNRSIELHIESQCRERLYTKIVPSGAVVSLAKDQNSFWLTISADGSAGARRRTYAIECEHVHRALIQDTLCSIVDGLTSCRPQIRAQAVQKLEELYKFKLPLGYRLLGMVPFLGRLKHRPWVNWTDQQALHVPAFSAAILASARKEGVPLTVAHSPLAESVELLDGLRRYSFTITDRAAHLPAFMNLELRPNNWGIGTISDRLGGSLAVTLAAGDEQARRVAQAFILAPEEFDRAEEQSWGRGMARNRPKCGDEDSWAAYRHLVHLATQIENALGRSIETMRGAHSVQPAAHKGWRLTFIQPWRLELHCEPSGVASFALRPPMLCGMLTTFAIPEARRKELDVGRLTEYLSQMSVNSIVEQSMLWRYLSSLDSVVSYAAR